MSESKKRQKKEISEGKKDGRPLIEISEADWERMSKLSQIFCTRNEIADIMSISVETLNRRCKELFGLTFGAWIDQQSARGKMSLRRAQYKKAIEEGNPQMLMWLGKQYLNQSEKNEVKAEVKNINSITEWLHEDEKIIDVTPENEKAAEIEGQEDNS